MLKTNNLKWVFLAVCCFIIGCNSSSQDLNRTEKRIKGNYEEEITKLTEERDGLRIQLQKEIKINAELKAELEEMAKKLEELEQELVNLNADSSKIKPKEILSAPVSVSGEIRSVNKAKNIIIISLGEKDKIQPGMKLEIRRGDKLIGKIEVDGVETDWSTAHSISAQDSGQFQLGDSVKRPESE